MLENLSFSPIQEKSVSVESSSVFKEKKRIRGFNFMNIRKKQDSFMREMMALQTSFPIKNIKNFDFKMKKENVKAFLGRKKYSFYDIRNKDPKFNDNNNEKKMDRSNILNNNGENVRKNEKSDFEKNNTNALLANSDKNGMNFGEKQENYLDSEFTNSSRTNTDQNSQLAHERKKIKSFNFRQNKPIVFNTN